MCIRDSRGDPDVAQLVHHGFGDPVGHEHDGQPGFELLAPRGGGPAPRGRGGLLHLGGGACGEQVRGSRLGEHVVLLEKLEEEEDGQDEQFGEEPLAEQT